MKMNGVATQWIMQRKLAAAPMVSCDLTFPIENKIAVAATAIIRFISFDFLCKLITVHKPRER